MGRCYIYFFISFFLLLCVNIGLAIWAQTGKNLKLGGNVWLLQTVCLHVC